MHNDYLINFYCVNFHVFLYFYVHSCAKLLTHCKTHTDKIKIGKWFSYIFGLERERVLTPSFMRIGLPCEVLVICLWGRISSYMTLHRVPSQFPFLFNSTWKGISVVGESCMACVKGQDMGWVWSPAVFLFTVKESIKHRIQSNIFWS